MQKQCYEEQGLDKTYSLFDYCCLNWDNVSKDEKFFWTFNTTTYLESRYITCHFDSKFFESEIEPDKQTRNFYMQIWRGSSKILQNLMRFHLNSDSKTYKEAQNKLRSPEFQAYAMSNFNQINDLLFAFTFLPNQFANTQDYKKLITETKEYKYYKSIMEIDEYLYNHFLIIEKNHNITPVDQIDQKKNNNNNDKITSSLVSLFTKIDPKKETNEIDNILFINYSIKVEKLISELLKLNNNELNYEEQKHADETSILPETTNKQLQKQTQTWKKFKIAAFIFASIALSMSTATICICFPPAAALFGIVTVAVKSLLAVGIISVACASATAAISLAVISAVKHKFPTSAGFSKIQTETEIQIQPKKTQDKIPLLET